MKLKSQILNLKSTGPRPRVEGRGSREEHPLRFTLHALRSTLPAPPRERGVALVITLILLAVIAFMAIAFLVLSYGQRAASTTATDQALARQAADAALDRAQIEILASIMANRNANLYDLCVSTNYINPAGFFPGVSSPTNVNYEFLRAGGPLGPADLLQNLANLVYNPRPPVFIVTNRATGSNEFRYYIDLNQNRRFEPSGLLPVINPLGTYYDTNGNIIAQITPGNTLSNFVVGDVQWIGGLEYPDRPHAADNKFLFRYAYLVLPASKILDINTIHNAAYAANRSLPAPPAVVPVDPTGIDFTRNEGLGTWEINLAAFLYDLNTNLYAWGGVPYRYEPLDGDPPGNLRLVKGTGFEDSASLVAYRYNYNLNTLLSATALGMATNFIQDGFDGYGSSDPFTNDFARQLDPDVNRITRAWSGANSFNHFFTMEEVLDSTKLGTNFIAHLWNAGTNNSTYDRYTFYRLLSQLGTDTSPEPAGTINLNYDNLVQTNALGVASATNLYPWRPIDFFTNAANAMLAKAGYAFTTTNIQVWPTNFYASSVHRILQLAANIYDATTNRTLGDASISNGFPSVFRPLFRQAPAPDGRVFIAGYREVTNTVLALYPPTNVDFSIGLNTNGNIFDYGTPFDPDDRKEAMVAGIPVVIGARKGYPNFNEFLMQTEVAVTRKLEFTNSSSVVTNLAGLRTNQMYIIGISNSFGVEAWNPYTNAYLRNLQMLVSVVAYTAMATNPAPTNSQDYVYTNNYPFFSSRGQLAVLQSTGVVFSFAGWAGYDPVGHPLNNQYSFVAPLHPETNNFLPLPAASLSSLRDCLVVPYQTNFESLPIGPTTGPFPVPQWYVIMKKRVRYVLLDTKADRIVDYVNLAADDPPVDVLGAFASDSPRFGRTNYVVDGSIGSMWLTNRGTNFDGNYMYPTFGILNQINVSLGNVTANPPWVSRVPPVMNPNGAINFFRTNLLHTNAINAAQTPLFLTNRFYSPYVPSRTNYIFTWWQANDPFVHYTVNDLDVRTNRYFLSPSSLTLGDVGGLDPNYLAQSPSVYVPVGAQVPLNNRYDPWGGNPGRSQPGANDYQVAVKDPMVTRADDFQFPTNKFPNVGWLGRIHRGTPWQTVYLKALDIDLPTWQHESGNPQTLVNYGQIDPRIVGTNVAYADAAFTFPTNDWRLLDVFSTSFNDNAGRGKLSINQSGLAAWSAVLSGVVALTNVTPDDVLASDPTSVLVTNNGVVIPPAGVYDAFQPSNLPPLVRIVNAINNTRAALTNQNQTFLRLGDILSVPELTVGRAYFTNGYWAGVSPFLNLSGAFNPATKGFSLTYQQTLDLNDAAYERIPQQILGLIKCEDKPRLVIYSWGQALKPADRSIVQSSGPFFGLCTNYQITAETATRAVVRIDGAPDNPHTVIESFNVLPPE